jgi:hypothetical protein
MDGNTQLSHVFSSTIRWFEGPLGKSIATVVVLPILLWPLISVLFSPALRKLVYRVRFHSLRTSVQRVPGSGLRVFSESIFSRHTYSKVLEPILRDLLDEYCAALAEKSPWKARLVRMRGYWSFWSAVIAQMPISVVKTIYQIWKIGR